MYVITSYFIITGLVHSILFYLGKKPGWNLSWDEAFQFYYKQNNTSKVFRDPKDHAYNRAFSKLSCLFFLCFITGWCSLPHYLVEKYIQSYLEK